MRKEQKDYEKRWQQFKILKERDLRERKRPVKRVNDRRFTLTAFFHNAERENILQILKIKLFRQHQQREFLSFFPQHSVPRGSQFKLIFEMLAEIINALREFFFCLLLFFHFTYFFSSISLHSAHFFLHHYAQYFSPFHSFLPFHLLKCFTSLTHWNFHYFECKKRNFNSILNKADNQISSKGRKKHQKAYFYFYFTFFQLN